MLELTIQMVSGGLGVRLAFVPVTDNKTGRKKCMVRVEEIDPLGPASQVDTLESFSNR